MRSATAQSFLESVYTSLSSPFETGQKGDGPIEAGTCSCCCRCGRLSKWEPAGPQRRRSKSYTALRTSVSEVSGWEWESPRVAEPMALDVVKTYGPGEAPLERLPVEILGEIGTPFSVVATATTTTMTKEQL